VDKVYGCTHWDTRYDRSDRGGAEKQIVNRRPYDIEGGQ
jgi:hypothetical protein